MTGLPRAVEIAALSLIVVPLVACGGAAYLRLNPYYVADEDVVLLRRQIDAYHDSTSALPQALADLCPSFPRRYCDWMPGYFSFRDPWGRTFAYHLVGQEYELRSAGPDRRFGTTDDLVFRPSYEVRMVQQIAGCYRLLQHGWDRLQGDELRLESVELSGNPVFRPVGKYRAHPSIGPMRPYWQPMGPDSIMVTWNDIHHSMNFMLSVQGDTLRGYYRWGWGYAPRFRTPDDSGPVYATRESCAQAGAPDE
jgi:hypothetical protein